MKRLLLLFTGLLALTASSCALSSFLTALPKNLTEQTVDCPTGGKAKAERFKVLSTEPWSQGVIVLYSALCPTDSTKTVMQPIFGHQVVKHNGMIWQVSGSGSYGTEAETVSSEQLVEYGMSRSIKLPNTNASPYEEPYAIVYGRVLKPKVAAIEVTFDNGKTLRDDSSNGVFALLSAGATGICALRVLGADNQILRQEDLAVPKYLPYEGIATRCLPVSHQT